MLGYLLKFLFLFMLVMISLNIFLPEQAHKIIVLGSEYTDIKEDVLKSYLDTATTFTQDTFSEVFTKIKGFFAD